MEEKDGAPRKLLKFARRVRRIGRIRRRSVPGAPPGTIIADPDAPKPVISLFEFSQAEFIEKRVESTEELLDPPPTERITWINVDGLGDAEVVRKIGEAYELHPLALEDVVNTHQRAKVEHYDDNLFIVARMPIPGKGVETEQVSIFVRNNTLITFQEVAGGDVFESVRDRLKKGKGKIRERGPDYLCYALLDAIIDSYFPLVEEYSDRLEKVEMECERARGEEFTSELHSIKQDLMVIRRAMWPLRDAVNQLIRDSEGFFREETRLYLRDCYDHTSQLIEIVETYRELCSDLRDVFHSALNNRMSEVMKVLTIMSTILIPLNFIAGVYGMNFNTSVSPYNMPELDSQYGYPLTLCVMLTVALSLIFLFRRKGWM